MMYPRVILLHKLIYNLKKTIDEVPNETIVVNVGNILESLSKQDQAEVREIAE